MFCKTFTTTVNLFAMLLCFVAILSTAAPLARRAGTLAERELVPVVPGTPIQPPLVDLLDQFQNLQKQFDAASPDDPNFDALSKQLNDTKANLDQAIKGVAVLATSSAPASSDTATPTPASSGTSTPTTTGSASTTSPSTSINTDVPVVTVVTQVGTSIVVIASQGVTSTVTLATITTVQSGPVSSPTSSVATSTSSSSATGSSSPSTATGVTGSTTTATRAATTGKTANSSVGQAAGSGAIAIAPKSIATIMLGGSLLGVMMVL